MGDMLWAPPADVRERSRIGAYLRWLREHRGLDFADYDALWRWSTTDLDGFWRSIWDHFEVIAHTPPTATLAQRAMPGARWFPDATLNYAENVLRMPGRADDDPVVISHGQTRPPVTLTAGELREQVRRVSAGLRRLGVTAGDRVAAYAPNIAETYVLLLATASLGAIFSSCAPEFGTRSVTDRWQQIEPTVLVAVDGYRYGDKPVDRRAEVAAIRAALPSVRHTVSIGYLDPTSPAPEGALGWAELAAPTDEPLTFTPVPFDHPLYVLYSSGTTGLPKPIVHGHGGILLEHLKMLALHHDLGPTDRFFWFTTTGWMMWNFLVSGPAVGAAIVLFDGNPGVRAEPAIRPSRTSAGCGGWRRRPAPRTSAPPRRTCWPAARPGWSPGTSPTCRRCAAWVPQVRRCPPRASAGCTRPSASTSNSSRSPAAPTCAPASSAGCRCCRCTPVRLPAGRWARRWRPVPPTARRSSASWASW